MLSWIHDFELRWQIISPSIEARTAKGSGRRSYRRETGNLRKERGLWPRGMEQALLVLWWPCSKAGR